MSNDHTLLGRMGGGLGGGGLLFAFLSRIEHMHQTPFFLHVIFFFVDLSPLARAARNAVEHDLCNSG